MNFINEYGLAFGWTLIHMAWISLSMAVIVQFLRLAIRNPRFRYGLGMLSMLSLPIIASVIFLGQIDFSSQSYTMVNGDGFVNATLLFTGADDMSILSIGTWINQHMDWILVLWFAGMISFIVRLMFGYSALVGFRQSIQPMSDYWSDRFQNILKEFNIKANVLLGSSKRVDGPMTFGFVKPMILLPIGLVNALSVDEVEAIIRHELAHIARHDYVFKMIQSAIESLFYYTPGTWWLTKMVDIDREQCCDDYAIRSGSNAAAYVNALYKVNTFNTLESQLALGFGKEKNQLLNRVKRILKQPQEKANIMGRLIIPIILLIIVAGVSINATLKDNYKTDAAETNILTEAAGEVVPVMPVVDNTVIVTPQDTTKRKSKSTISSRVNGNGKSYSVTREDGKITEMKVDGKKIDPQDYQKYEDDMKESFRSDGMHYDFDVDMTEEEKAELKARMKEFEKKMEGFGKSIDESFGEDFEKRMEGFGESMEKWGAQFEEDGDWDDFGNKMAEWGEKFGKSFGEDFGQGMAEWGEAFGKEFADAFTFNFDTEGIEKWGEDLERKVEEYRMKHPEKFYQGGDGEWHLKEDNLTFEETEEIFGKGWTDNLTENITKMFEDFDFDVTTPPVPPAIGNLPAPPAPPSIGSLPTPPAAPFKLEMKELKSALVSDGFFKDSNEVSFKMDESNLSINGKAQSAKVYKKYKKIIEDNWGADYLEDYDIDFNIIDKKAKKKMTGTYRI